MNTPFTILSALSASLFCMSCQTDESSLLDEKRNDSCINDEFFSKIATVVVQFPVDPYPKFECLGVPISPIAVAVPAYCLYRSHASQSYYPTGIRIEKLSYSSIYREPLPPPFEKAIEKDKAFISENAYVHPKFAQSFAANDEHAIPFSTAVLALKEPIEGFAWFELPKEKEINLSNLWQSFTMISLAHEEKQESIDLYSHLVYPTKVSVGSPNAFWQLNSKSQKVDVANLGAPVWQTDLLAGQWVKSGKIIRDESTKRGFTEEFFVNPWQGEMLAYLRQLRRKSCEDFMQRFKSANDLPMNNIKWHEFATSSCRRIVAAG